jgi:hypothetical protein
MTLVPAAKKALLSAGVWLLCGHSMPGADLSTVNRNCLAHFWAAAEQCTRPVTIVSFGDSMADSYRSLNMVLVDKFTERLGTAGYALNNYRNTLMLNLTNGSQFVGPSRFWYTSHLRVPAGGGVWWETQTSPDGLWCDCVGLFYVAHPEGGDMTLSVSTKGGPWTSLLSLDGCASSPAGRYKRVDLPLNYHRLRVDSLGGVNFVIGPQMLNAQSRGVQAVFNDEGGIELSQVTNVPLAIRGPIFRALLPDLLIWVGSDTNTSYSIDQNGLLRSTAIACRRGYVDCMTPAISYPWMMAQGYMVDAVHLNVQGSTYLANIAWNDMGFFALRTPRTLYQQQVSGTITLTYATATSVFYTLESSTNLLHWDSLSSLPGTGCTLQTNFPTDGQQRVFRLRLTPSPE